MKRLVVYLVDGSIEYFPGDSEFEFFSPGDCYLIHCGHCVYSVPVKDIKDCGLGYENY